MSFFEKRKDVLPFYEICKSKVYKHFLDNPKSMFTINDLCKELKLSESIVKRCINKLVNEGKLEVVRSVILFYKLKGEESQRHSR